MSEEKSVASTCSALFERAPSVDLRVGDMIVANIWDSEREIAEITDDVRGDYWVGMMDPIYFKRATFSDGTSRALPDMVWRVFSRNPERERDALDASPPINLT